MCTHIYTRPHEHTHTKLYGINIEVFLPGDTMFVPDLSKCGLLCGVQLAKMWLPVSCHHKKSLCNQSRECLVLQF